jgi:Putative Actinobacterial Holin-X, holin superfamily III
MSVENGNAGGIGAGDGTPSDGGAKRPIGVVVASAVNGARALLTKHVELAKLEVGAAVGVRAAGAGLMAAAGALALLAFGFVAAAGAAALALVMPTWAAILIVAVLLLATAGVLVLVGRRAIRTAPAMADRSRETMKEDARWAKQQIAK